jgi:predicted MFS family arabinose efflux permease
VTPAFATSPVMLFCVLLLFGASGAANDISMNSQAVAVEQALGSPTMSRFHALFSVGGMAGAGIGGIVAAHAISPKPHFATASGFFILLAVITAPWLLTTPPVHAGRRQRFRMQYLSPALVALVVVGFSMFLSEAAIGDWSAVYLQQSLGAGAGMAAAAYAVFSVGMTIFRFLGDEITARIGPAATVRGGALLAAAGLSWALLARSASWSLPGFALTGAGFSSIIPLVFGAGGRIRSVPSSAGVAFVAGAGYIGFLFGPPIIGLLAARSSVRIALFLIVALSLVAATLAGAVRQEKSAS